MTELFKDVAAKIGTRPGGYTRIIKTGHRVGDNAAMCFIELVDYNENMLKTVVRKGSKTRRSSRKKTTAQGVPAIDATVNDVTGDSPEMEETKEE